MTQIQNNQDTSPEQSQNPDCPKWRAALDDTKKLLPAYFKLLADCEKQKDFNNQAIKKLKETIKAAIKKMADFNLDQLGARQRIAKQIGASYVGKFSEGIAMAQNKDGNIYINKKGEQIPIDSGYEPLGKFSNGLALVRTQVANFVMFNYVDKKGKLLLKEDTAVARDFHDGLAAVSLRGENIYIKTNGERAFTATFDVNNDFKDGVAIVQKKGSKLYDLIDTRGKELVSGAIAIQDDVEIVGDTKLRLVLNADSTFMYVDTKGNIIGGRSFDALGIYRDGVCAAKEKDKWILLDLRGNEVGLKDHEGLCLSPAVESSKFTSGPFPPTRYVYLLSIENGEIVVHKKSGISIFSTKPNQIVEVSISQQLFKLQIERNREQLIDGKGKILNEAVFSSLSITKSGLIEAKTADGSYYLLNRHGVPVVNMAFDGIEDDSEITRAFKDFYYWLFDKNGLINNNRYTNPGRFEDGVMFVSLTTDKGQEFFFIDRRGRRVFTDLV